MAEPKQVILARKDLNMSPGKLAAQVAHASMGAVLEVGEGEALKAWLEGTFTKIVLGVNSQEELLVLYEVAVREGVRCKLILDSGRTEFNGNPTYTCVAIGPEFPEKLDRITGHLKLY